MYQKNKHSTQHGPKTPFGLKTPHKFPSKTSDAEDFMRLVNQLYPHHLLHIKHTPLN